MFSDRDLEKNALLLYYVPGSKFDANDDRSVEQNKSLDEPSKLMYWSIKNL